MNTLFFNSAPAPLTTSTHELKVWPACFEAVADGRKAFDVRLNDRDYQVGDALLLREYEPESEQYSGRTTDRWISYLMQGGAFGLEPGWCVLGLAEHPPQPPGMNDARLW